MKHGDQVKIAKIAGVTGQYVNYILNGKRTPSHDMAYTLSDASKQIGLKISPEDWMFRATSIKVKK